MLIDTSQGACPYLACVCVVLFAAVCSRQSSEHQSECYAGCEEIAQTVATPALATPGAGGEGVGPDEEEKERRPCYERVGGRKMRRGCLGMLGDLWECWEMFRDD